MMKRIFTLFVSVLFMQPAFAQFTPGQVLSAAQLNAALSAKTTNSSAAITGGTITGVSANAMTFQSGSSGSVSRSVQSKFQDIVNAADFGAQCNGSGNDTAAISAAAQASNYVMIPAGNCIVSSSIAVSTPVTFVGMGMGSTTITPSGNFDVFAYTGNVNGGGLRDLTIKASGMTGGNIISNVGQGRFTLSNLQIVAGYNGIYLQDFNVNTLRNLWLSGQTGQYSVKAYGSAFGNANVLDMDNVTIGFTTNTASSPVGLIVDSGVATVDLRHVAVVKGYRGMQITNTLNTSPGPSFITVYDFQSDFPYAECIYADGGSTAVRTLYFEDTYCHQSQSAAGINFTSTVSNAVVHSGMSSGNYQQGILTNASYLKISDLQVAGNSLAGSALYPGIELGASSKGTSIRGGVAGTWTGYSTNLQSYGVQTDSGATAYAISGVDLAGNVTGPYIDNAADSASAIAFNSGVSTAVNRISGPIQSTSGNLTMQAGATSSFVNLGSTNGTGLSVQAASASTVNFTRAFGSATGVAPTLQAVGSDTNISLKLAATGTGTVFSTAIVNPQAGVLFPVTTVASLPTCGTSQKGLMYAVSDATSPTYNGALTGGGAVSVPVYCNGSAWTSH